VNDMVKNRKLNRLTGFDYSQEGAYFITICTYEKKYLFGRITTTAAVGANGRSPDIEQNGRSPDNCSCVIG